MHMHSLRAIPTTLAFLIMASLIAFGEADFDFDSTSASDRPRIMI